MNGKNTHGISCEAKNCVFHKGESTCTAPSIRVGNEKACCCSDTRCASFKMNEKVTENNPIPW
jgi:hypothetical protein